MTRSLDGRITFGTGATGALGRTVARRLPGLRAPG